MTLRFHRRRRNQRGFALLLVFLMAAAVALMLYSQLPRQAFESERDKEQLLIDRGEEYKRAVYLYYVSNNRQWPSKMEDLESTNGHRYLRERFVDPYTGKNEWRLIHTNGAFLTDSLVTPPPAQTTPGANGVLPGGALAGTGAPTTTGFSLDSPLVASSTAPGANPNARPAVNAAAQRRASDNTMVQTANYQNLAGGGPVTANNDPGYQPFNPAALPPITMYPNGYNQPPVNAPGMLGAGPQPGFNPNGGVNPNGTLNQNGIPNQPGAVPAGGVYGNMLNQANASINNGNPNGNPTGINPAGGFGVPNQTAPNQVAPNQVGASVATIPGTNFAVNNPGFTPPTFNQGLGSSGMGGASPNQFGVSQPGTDPFNSSTSPQQPGAAPFGSQSLGGSQPFGGQPFGGQPFGGQPFGGQPGAVPGAPPGVPSLPGMNGPGGGNNPALSIIGNLLTTPRQPPPGIGPNQNSTSGGGLAGVASTYKGATIKSYGDRTKYQEWEFVFQLNQLNTQTNSGTQLQAPQGPNGTGGIPNDGQLSPGSPGAPGTPATQTPFGIGGTGAGGFGAGGFGTGGTSTAPASPFGTH